MNSRLFFPLLKQTGFWLYLLILIQIGVWCWVGECWSQVPVPAGVFGLRLMLSLAMWTGLLFAGIILELLHASVAPILPGLRPKLVVWLVCLPASVALLVTALDAVLWGGVPVASLFAIAWMSATIGFLPLGPLNRGNSQLLVVLGYGVLIWQADWLLALIRSWPWLVTLAGAGGAGICLKLGLSRARWRQHALTRQWSAWGLGDPPLFRQWREAQSGQTKPARTKAGPRWLEQKLGRNPWHWTRAVFYEYSSRPRSLFFVFGLIYISSVAGGILMAFFIGDHGGYLSLQLVRLLGEIDAAHPAYLMTPKGGQDWICFVSAAFIFSSMGRQFGLRVYPLSRSERAGIAYRVCLVLNAGCCAWLFLIKVALVAAFTLMVDKLPIWPPVPWFVIEVLMAAVYIPLLQSLVVISVNKNNAMALGVFFIIIPVSILPGVVGGLLPPMWLAVIFLLLALAVQAGLYFFLRRCFLRCDLVGVPA